MHEQNGGPGVRYITIDKFSELSGYSAGAVRQKIQRGDWLEGEVFFKAPDGRILINLEGYHKWVTKGYAPRLPLPLK
jgi:hypothetical protein